MSNYKDFVRRWLPLIVWMAAIFILSHQPKDAIPNYGAWDFLVKKSGHIVAYALLAILARRAGFTTTAALAFVLAYAFSDELHQRYVPGRTGSVEDMLIDLFGAILGLLVMWLLPQSWRVFLWGQTRSLGEQSPRDV